MRIPQKSEREVPEKYVRRIPVQIYVRHFLSYICIVYYILYINVYIRKHTLSISNTISTIMNSSTSEGEKRSYCNIYENILT